MSEEKIDILLEGLAVMLEKDSTDFDKQQVLNKIHNTLYPKQITEPYPERAKEGLGSKKGCGKPIGFSSFCGSKDEPFFGDDLCEKCQAKHDKRVESASTLGTENVINVKEGKKFKCATCGRLYTKELDAIACEGADELEGITKTEDGDVKNVKEVSE